MPSFERSCQVFRNECLADGTGTVFVTVGTAGANLEAGWNLQDDCFSAHRRLFKRTWQLVCGTHRAVRIQSRDCHRELHECSGFYRLFFLSLIFSSSSMLTTPFTMNSHCIHGQRPKPDASVCSNSQKNANKIFLRSDIKMIEATPAWMQSGA